MFIASKLPDLVTQTIDYKNNNSGKELLLKRARTARLISFYVAGLNVSEDYDIITKEIRLALLEKLKKVAEDCVTIASVIHIKRKIMSPVRSAF